MKNDVGTIAERFVDGGLIDHGTVHETETIGVAAMSGVGRQDLLDVLGTPTGQVIEDTHMVPHSQQSFGDV